MSDYERGIVDLHEALTDSKFIKFNYGVTPQHLAQILHSFNPLHIVADYKDYMKDMEET